MKKVYEWIVRLFKDRQNHNPYKTFRIGKAQLEFDSIKMRRAINNGTSCR